MQRFLIPLFVFVWWNRLNREHRSYSGMIIRDHVVKVKGWRTALLDVYGTGRQTTTFLFGSSYSKKKQTGRKVKK